MRFPFPSSAEVHPDEGLDHEGHVNFGQLERNWYEIEYAFNGLAFKINEVIAATSASNSTPTDSAPGDAAVPGSASDLSRSDHRHGRESFGGVGASALGDTSNAGTSTSVSRADHRHARETAFPAGRKNLTTQNLVITSTAWANLSSLSSTVLDVTLAATTNNWVEVGLSALCSSTEGVGLRMDAVSIVAGAAVNSWSADGPPLTTRGGVMAWFSPPGEQTNIAGSIIRKVTTDDISVGTVTVRPRAKLGSTAAPQRSVAGEPDNPLTFWARVL